MAPVRSSSGKPDAMLPLVKSKSPLCPCGVLAKNHCLGDLISIGICEPSKSSTYEVAAPSKFIPLGEPGNKWAASGCW